MSPPPNLRSFTSRAEIVRELAADRPTYHRSSLRRRLDAFEREYEQETDVLGRLRWPTTDDRPFGVAGGVRRPRTTQDRRSSK